MPVTLFDSDEHKDGDYHYEERLLIEFDTNRGYQPTLNVKAKIGDVEKLDVVVAWNTAWPDIEHIGNSILCGITEDELTTHEQWEKRFAESYEAALNPILHFTVY